MKDDRSKTTISAARKAGHGREIHLLLLFRLRQIFHI